MPSNMIWNGGRAFFSAKVQGPEIYRVIDFLRQYDIKLRHTCTNMLL